MPNKIVRKGYIKSLDDFNSIIRCQSGGNVVAHFDSISTKEAFDDKYVKITIEVIDESELDITNEDLLGDG